MISTAVFTPRRDHAHAESSVRLSCVTPSAAEPAMPLEGSLAVAGPISISDGAAASEALGPWWYVDASSTPQGGAAVLSAGLHGWTRAGPRLDWTHASPHVLGGMATWIGLGVDEAHTQLRCFASLQHVEAQAFDPAPVLATAPRVELSGTRATLGWSDGTLAWTELADVLPERVIELGGVRFAGPLRMLMVERRDAELHLRAIGARTIGDEQGLLLSSREARDLVVCTFTPTRWRCEVDGPIRLARARMPGAARVVGDDNVVVDGEWVHVEPRFDVRTTATIEVGP